MVILIMELNCVYNVIGDVKYVKHHLQIVKNVKVLIVILMINVNVMINFMKLVLILYVKVNIYNLYYFLDCLEPCDLCD